jgi:hypothetical protein
VGKHCGGAPLLPGPNLHHQDIKAQSCSRPNLVLRNCKIGKKRKKARPCTRPNLVVTERGEVIFYAKTKQTKNAPKHPHTHARAPSRSLANTHPPATHSRQPLAPRRTHTHPLTNSCPPTRPNTHPRPPTHIHAPHPPNPTVVGQAVHRRGRRKWSFKTWSSSNPTPPAHTNTNTELGEPGTGPVTGTG